MSVSVPMRNLSNIYFGYRSKLGTKKNRFDYSFLKEDSIKLCQNDQENRYILSRGRKLEYNFKTNEFVHKNAKLQENEMVKGWFKLKKLD